MYIYTRTEWRARIPHPMSEQGVIREAFLHHSEDARGDVYDTLAKQKAKVRAIQDFHMDGRGWSDIAYAYLIFQWVGTRNRRVQPRVFAGRATRYVPAAQLNHNTGTLPICVIGNGDTEILHPATIKVIAALVKEHPTVQVFGGHRDVVATDCPGHNFYVRIANIAHAAGVRVYKPSK